MLDTVERHKKKSLRLLFVGKLDAEQRLRLRRAEAHVRLRRVWDALRDRGAWVRDVAPTVASVQHDRVRGPDLRAGLLLEGGAAVFQPHKLLGLHVHALDVGQVVSSLLELLLEEPSGPLALGAGGHDEDGNVALAGKLKEGFSDGLDLEAVVVGRMVEDERLVDVKDDGRRLLQAPRNGLVDHVGADLRGLSGVAGHPYQMVIVFGHGRRVVGQVGHFFFSDKKKYWRSRPRHERL